MKTTIATIIVLGSTFMPLVSISGLMPSIPAELIGIETFSDFQGIVISEK